MPEGERDGDGCSGVPEGERDGDGCRVVVRDGVVEWDAVGVAEAGQSDRRPTTLSKQLPAYLAGLMWLSHDAGSVLLKKLLTTVTDLRQRKTWTDGGRWIQGKSGRAPDERESRKRRAWTTCTSRQGQLSRLLQGRQLIDGRQASTEGIRRQV